MNTSKIIKGVVGGGRYTVTAPIVKEDYGLYLKIEGLELPSTYEVDFSNSEHNGTSVTMIGNSDGVLIPSQFISSGKDVFAFLYHVGEDFGRTVYKFRIPNKLRPDRTDETPTPEEQSVIDQAISALNDAVAQTAQDKADADVSAQNASADAERAEEARTDAQNFATQAEQAMDDAQTYANNASTSATASATSASQAEQIKSDVEGMVDDARDYASASYQSAQTAQGYASNAQLSATQANNSAMSANQSASDALTHANTASSKATEASTSASTASAKATESAQSATNAQGYANTAESAKTASQTAQGLAESARDLAQGYAEDAQGYAEDAQASAEGISASASQIAQNTANILKAFPTDTASGAVASFTDGADDLPLKSLVVDINPVQDLSQGDPSPENICPISGWTGMTVNASGKNLLPMPIVSGSYDYTTVIAVNDDKSFTITKTNKSGWSSFILGRFMLKHGAYTLIESDDNSKNAQLVLDKVIGDTTEILLTTRYTKRITFTVGADTLVQARYIRSAIANNVLTKLMLFVGNTATATDYEPYQGQSIPISWKTEAGTVYGGKLDVLSGNLTVYPYYASYNGETLTGRWISDRDVYAVGTTPTIGAQVVDMSGTGTEVQLEPHEIASLLGANNIWADAGDANVEYRADTRLYIEKLTQPEEDDMVADSAITSGQFFMIGNSLYRALANIASGATITVGTNAQRVSLADALNLINT